MKDFPVPVITETASDDTDVTAIAKQWLSDSARTASARDYDAHMNLISRKVVVRGVPGHETVGYDDWARQCKQEFSQGVLESVSYRGIKMLAANDYRIMFKTIELLQPRDANATEQGIEVVLQKEDDGVWRVIQERLLSTEELRHDGML